MPVSRREFLKLAGCGATGAVASKLLAACSLPEEIISPTSTYSPTPSLFSSPTPTSTFTPTITIPPTETSTVTPEPTVTPTHFPERKYNTLIFGSNGNLSGFDVHTDRQGTTVQEVPDPTDSGRGTVIQAIIVGDPVKQSGNYYAYRGYDGRYLNISGEIKIEEEVFVSGQFLADATTGGRWFVHHNIFDKTGRDGGEWHVVIRSTIRRSSNGCMVLALEGGSKEYILESVENAPKFTADKWHRMAIEIREETNKWGKKVWIVYLFQDMKLVSFGELPSWVRKDNMGRPIWRSYHGGLYAGSGRSLDAARFRKGGYVLVDNVAIRTP